jgi:hypothetical protein
MASDSLADRKDKQFADLGAAINNFTASAQQLKMTNALRQASQTVQQVKASAMKDEEKRAQLQGLANNLVLNMTQFGADPQAIAQAAGAIMPPKDPMVQTSEQAILMGSPEQQKRGKQLMETEFMQKLALMSAGQKAKGKALKPLTTGEVGDLQAMEEASTSLQDIINSVKKNKTLVGPVEGRKGMVGRGTLYDPEFGAFRQKLETFFNEYRRKITGAAAGIPEIKALEKAVPRGTESLDVFLKRAESALKINEGAKKRYAETLRKAGRDFDGFDTTTGAPMAPTGEPSQPEPGAGQVGIPGLSFE